MFCEICNKDIISSNLCSYCKSGLENILELNQKKMNIDIVDMKNTISLQKSLSISNLALIKHMAFSGMGYNLSLRKLMRMIGMYLHYNYYLKDLTSNNCFSKLPDYLYDPTELSHFSNIVGKAFADYVSKKIYNSFATFSYEAALKILINNGKIANTKDKRGDLIAFTSNGMFAVEAKGLSDKKIYKTTIDKAKAQLSEILIGVNFSVISISHNIYKKIKLKYEYIENSSGLNNNYYKELKKDLFINYYNNISSFINENVFEVSNIEIKKKDFHLLRFQEDFISKELSNFSLFLKLEDITEKFAILITKDIDIYKDKGIEENFIREYSYEDENTYIDVDGIGIMIKNDE